MTLILTCVTNDTVFQVSDRRLTKFSPKRELVDDDSNKAVMAAGRVAFGYTGISQIESLRTDEWLARTIASRPTDDLDVMFSHIKEKATKAFSRMPFASRYKRHAFQAVGWFSSPDSNALFPGVVTIHNAIAPNGNGWMPYAKNEFEIKEFFGILGKRQFYLTSAGLNPSPQERDAIYRIVQKCVHRRSGRNALILDTLSASIRWLSERYEPGSTVGKNLMAICIPKVSVENFLRSGEYHALMSSPIDEIATFLDIPEFGRPIAYGPTFVSGGMVISGIKRVPL